MNKIKKIMLVVVSIISCSVFANENQKEEKHVPVVVSFVSNEFYFASKKNIVANAAIGILGSTLYQVNGVQLSNLMNITHKVNGIQGAGLFNINTNDFAGFENAGLFNINAGRFAGIQASGVMNINCGKFYGAQLAGVMNVNAGAIAGFQGAGVMNIACGEDSYGVQTASVMNIHSGNLNGVQIGLINICSGDCDFQFGLINISKNGIAELATSYTSNHQFRLAFNSGNQYCYSILGATYNNPFMEEKAIDWRYFANHVTFAGLGTRQTFGILNLDLEAIFNSAMFVNENNRIKSGNYPSGRVSAGITPVKHFNIFAGYSASFEHEWFYNSDLAFKYLKSNWKTAFDNGLTVHHEIDIGIKFQFN